MANYNPWVFTPMYLSADQGAAITSETIKFKRMVTTQDKLTVEDLPGLDNKVLETVKIAQSVGISSVVKKDNKVTVSAVFSNDKLTEGYDVNTVFLMAEYKGREFLAAITVANNAWHMSGTSDAERLEWTLKVTIATSNTEHISIEVDPTAVVINEQLDNTKREITETIALERQRVDALEAADKFNVKTTGDQDVKGVKRFWDLLQGTITKALTAIKLENARNINGVPFDGTEDIVVKASNDDDLVHKTGNENISGRKIFKDRSKHYGGLSLSVSDVNGNNAKNLSVLSIDTPSATKVGEIDFYGQTFYTNPAIENQVNDNYTLGLQSGGTVVVGSGEAATGIMTSMQEKNMPSSISSNGQAEQLILVADNTVYIGSGYQEGGSSGNWIVLRRDGDTLFPGNVSAARFIGNADTATRLAKPRKINGVEDDGTKDITIPTDSDSGWKTLTLSKDFAPWDDNPALTPIYKIRNGVVTIKGIVHPTRDFKPHEEGTIAQLPKELISNSKIKFSSVQQASSPDKWNLVVRVNGELSLQRYADGNSLKPMAVDTWLPFSVTYVL